MSTMYSIEHIRSINLFLFYFSKNYSHYLYNTLLLCWNAISIKKKNYPRTFETIHDRFINSSCFSRKATLLLFNINRKDNCILLKNLAVNDKKSVGWQLTVWRLKKVQARAWEVEDGSCAKCAPPSHRLDTVRDTSVNRKSVRPKRVVAVEADGKGVDVPRLRFVY